MVPKKYPYLKPFWKVIGNLGGGGGGVSSQKPKFLKEYLKLNWNFHWGVVGIFQIKNSSVGVYGYFLGPHICKIAGRKCCSNELFIQRSYNCYMAEQFNSSSDDFYKNTYFFTPLFKIKYHLIQSQVEWPVISTNLKDLMEYFNL